jgi:hypothetical protein
LQLHRNAAIGPFEMLEPDSTQENYLDELLQVMRGWLRHWPTSTSEYEREQMRCVLAANQTTLCLLYPRAIGASDTRSFNNVSSVTLHVWMADALELVFAIETMKQQIPMAMLKYEQTDRYLKKQFVASMLNFRPLLPTEFDVICTGAQVDYIGVLNATVPFYAICRDGSSQIRTFHSASMSSSSSTSTAHAPPECALISMHNWCCSAKLGQYRSRQWYNVPLVERSV